MMRRFAIQAIFPLLLVPAIALAQTDTPPPMKMGLWQSQVTVQMTGMPNGMSMPPRTSEAQLCITPDTWKDALRNMQAHRQDVDCAPVNMQQDSHHYTADVQCSSQGGMNMTVHVDMQFDSDTSMHGTTTAKVNGPNTPPGMTMNSTVSSKYLGADCGDVKPGQSKPVGGAPAGGPPS